MTTPETGSPDPDLDAAADADNLEESGPTTSSILSLENVVQEYPSPDQPGGRLRVVDGVSLDFAKPSINMLLGPSGCGKSTVLRMMGGVRPFGVKTPTKGRVLIDGEPCEGAHDDAVMVFQHYANRPDLSVRDNVAFPFRLGLWKKRISFSEQRERVDEILEAVGLGKHANLRPSQLSGGQNQRVALARALVLRPRILLMDEPFGALDVQTRDEMQRLLVDLWEQQQCLVVFVTHDVTEALVLADRVIVLSPMPAGIADDFVIDEPRPRAGLWQRSSTALKLEQRILEKLHQLEGHGEVSVTV
jgi:ABC-type nitrate/sulfonate/bicarbonate transport system ATPase subunit